jgi:hypothetical protein
MRLRTAALAILLAGALASCGTCGATTSGKQHLVFTGPVNGTLTQATTLCTVFSSQNQANFLLTGTLGGKDLTFNIQIHSNYGGPGTYQVGSLLDGAGEMRLQVGDFEASSATGAGIVTILGDGMSGTLSDSLSGGEHVEGRFACDKLNRG